MNIIRTGIFFILIFFSYTVLASNATIRNKYPNSVLSNDHGVLKEIDLDSSRDGVYPPPPFSPKQPLSSIYWHCFPRENITIDLRDFGYTSTDIGGDENYATLEITASNQSDITHEYFMRRMWPTSGYQARFNTWLRLMKGEKTVCIAGSLAKSEERTVSGKVRTIYSWVFVKLKTNKGCDSYFQGACPSSKRPNEMASRLGKKMESRFEL